uniref:Uncharacterized protein n=1 Tax=Arundo donax TaxID=35708 RepID=A0A0A9S1R8_ARUDO
MFMHDHHHILYEGTLYLYDKPGYCTRKSPTYYFMPQNLHLETVYPTLDTGKTTLYFKESHTANPKKNII